jgi:Zn-dependent protease
MFARPRRTHRDDTLLRVVGSLTEMLPGSFRIGRIAGVPLLLHWSVLVIVALVAVNLGPVAGAVATVIGIAGFLLSILLHELSHALVARRHGVGTMSIELWALGGMARLEREAPSSRAEGWIAAAGPLSSLVIGVVLGTVALVGHQLDLGATVVATLGWLALINGLLAVFNMLPGAPLDGGRIVRAWRWGRHGDRYRAATEAAAAGQFIGWAIAGIGFWLLLNGRSALMLVLTGVFIAVNARAEAISAVVQSRLSGTRIRDLTWFGVAHASPDTDAATMLWQRSRLGSSGVVAVEESDGQLSGLVAEDRLTAVPESDRSLVRLAQLMVPFSRLAHAGLDDEITDVLARINPSTPVVTVWDRGQLVGVVPAERLQARLRAASQGITRAGATS